MDRPFLFSKISGMDLFLSILLDDTICQLEKGNSRVIPVKSLRCWKNERHTGDPLPISEDTSLPLTNNISIKFSPIPIHGVQQHASVPYAFCKVVLFE